MFSAARGLAWEFFKFGLPHLLLSFLGALALPLFILMVFKVKGAFIPDDPSMIMIHVIFLQISGMIFASPIFYVLGNPARLFTLPLSSRAIALSQMVPTFLLVAFQVLLYSAIINRVFGLDWPSIGPAMFLATAVVTFQAAVYFSHRSLWLVPLTSSLLILECLWFNRRYGGLFAAPTHFWSEVTVIEWVTMIAALTGALALGCYGLALNRCGESINTRKFEAWVLSWFEGAPGGFPVFQGPSSAQFWFEWKQKGVFLPGSVLVLFFCTTFVWLLADRDIANLHYAFFVGGFMLSLVAFIAGLLIGNYGQSDVHYEIGHFLASRPMTNKSMSSKSIQAALLSLGSAWLLWAAGFGALHCLMIGLGVNPSEKFVEEARWWFVPATLLLAWIGLSIGMIITIAGHGLVIFQVAISAYIFWLIGTVALTFLPDPDWSRLFNAVCAIASGVALVCITVWLYLEALKKRYLGVADMVLALASFVGLAVFVSFGLAPATAAAVPLLIFSFGVVAMAVAPFAAAPLGVGWNRTR